MTEMLPTVIKDSLLYKTFHNSHNVYVKASSAASRP